MNRIADADNHLVGGDEPSPDALVGALSLADTLEEDRERYRDVIRDLTEFEEDQMLDRIDANATAEESRGLDIGHETPIA
jgi:hypothetical protein